MRPINLFHIAVVGPTLLYLSYAGIYKEKVPDAVYYAVGIAAVLMMLYHARRFVEKSAHEAVKKI